MLETQSVIGPNAATPGERISAVDALRGVALLGILLLNIEMFGLAENGHQDLLVGGISNPDLIVWAVMQVLFEGKMRAIFSMLFGAGVVLLTSRLERRGDAALAADIYYRRTLWLLAFGLLHAYLLWEGDILYEYAISGLFLFPFRKLQARSLIGLGLIVLVLSVPRAVFVAFHLEDLRALAVQADMDHAAGKTLTKKQRDAQEEWKETLEGLRPDAEAIQESLNDHRGSYVQLFMRRAPRVAEQEWSDYYDLGFFDTVGMMLIGMGLIKLGVVSAHRTTKFYAVMVPVGFGIGLPLAAYATYKQYASRFDPVVDAWVSATYEPARLAVALGYIGLVMLVVQAGVAPRLMHGLAAVGRMALTNYLATTIICTILFDGIGFGLFGYLRRYQLYFVVLGVWAALLLFSVAWLRFFLFGPAEWLWRSLTYWRLQPLRRDRSPSDGQSNSSTLSSLGPSAQSEV